MSTAWKLPVSGHSCRTPFLRTRGRHHSKGYETREKQQIYQLQKLNGFFSHPPEILGKKKKEVDPPELGVLMAKQHERVLMGVVSWVIDSWGDGLGGMEWVLCKCSMIWL